MKANPKHREPMYRPLRRYNLGSQLYQLLKDELGLGQQPKVAWFLVEELLQVIEQHYLGADMIETGQMLFVAPRRGVKPAHGQTAMDIPQKTIKLTVIDDEDINGYIGGDSIATIRLRRMLRMSHEAVRQGAALTHIQLALITGVSVKLVDKALKQHAQTTGELAPTRGVIDDCSSALTHKEQIVRLHLQGYSIKQICRRTAHARSSVERYIQRFQQVKELAELMKEPPSLTVMARILGCSKRLVKAYLQLIPEH